MRNSPSINDRLLAMEHTIAHHALITISSMTIPLSVSCCGSTRPADPSRHFSLNDSSRTFQQDPGTGWRQASRCYRREHV